MATVPTTGLRTRSLRRLRIGLTAGFGLVLCLPLLNQTLGIPRDARLAGSEHTIPPPVLTGRSWFSGQFCRDAEAWLSRRAGLRGCLVRLANQINYSVFRRPPASSGTQVLVGRDHWLFEAEYVRHYTRRTAMKPRQADRFGRNLADLHRRLADRGIALVVVISPSKAEIHPERLPAGMEPSEEARRRTNAYEMVKGRLAAARVPLVDGPALFRAAMQEGAPPLFPPGGTHWNQYGAQLAWDEVLRLAAPQRRDLPEPALTGWRMGRPVGTDTDLRDLLNLWHFGDEASGVPHPLVRTTGRGGLRVLAVGDSFAFTLADAMARTRAVASLELLYYFKRRFSYDWRTAPPPEPPLRHYLHDCGPLDPAAIDWEAEFARCDLVVLEMNQILVGSAGWGFPERAVVR